MEKIAVYSFRENSPTLLRLLALRISRLRVAFLSAVLCLAAAPNLNAAPTNSKIAALVPVINLLLAEDGPIPLVVGRNNSRDYSSDRYPDGIEFFFGRLPEEIDLTINMANIPVGAQIEILINGQLIRTLSNGRNTFTLPASGAARNSIVIRVKNGTTGTWTITNIIALLATGPRTRAEAQLLLMRATFGPTVGELDRVRAIGYEAWIDEQMRVPQTYTQPLYEQEIIDRRATRRQDLINQGVTDPEKLKNTKLGATQLFVTRMDTWWHASIKGNDQLRQRVAYALSEIFSVTETNPRLIPYFHDTLAENAFANYYDLLRNVSLTPKMGVYLGMLNSTKETTGPFPSKPDENFAREVMQLFSIGLVELNIDGSEKKRNGQSIETYNQDTVRNLARVFTCWHTGLDARFSPGWEKIPMKPRPDEARWHDQGAKTLLNGHENPAGLTTEEDFNRALRNIADHPNVGPYIGTLLIKRLVTSNPSRAYVKRVAEAFNDNGRGVRGDMGAVIKAILLDQEAINGPQNPTGGKPKQPVIAMAQLWRMLNARSSIRYIRYTQPQRAFGQRPYGASTVFGYYEPDYAPSGPLEQQGLTAPEFKILSDGNIRGSLDEMFRLVTAKPHVNDSGMLEDNKLTRPMVLNLNELKGRADNLESLLDIIDERFFGGLISDKLRSVTISHVSSLKREGTLDEFRQRRVEEALAVTLVAPEFRVQR